MRVADGVLVASCRQMRSSLLAIFVAASALVVAGCGSSSGGGSGGSGGISNGSGGTMGGGGTGGTAGAGGQAGAPGGGGHGGAAGAGGHAGGGGAAGGGAGQGGAGGQGGTGASTDCNPPCTGQTVCVGSGTQGGAVFLADAGVCPQGRHLQGSICIQDLGYSCAAIPAGCNGTVTCSCAASSLCTQQQICTQVGTNELTCVLEAP